MRSAGRGPGEQSAPQQAPCDRLDVARRSAVGARRRRRRTPPALTQYAHTAWRVRDGYFPGQPTAIAQTMDGFLWIGTQNGLIRFDGVRFMPWEPPAGSKSSE